MRTTDDDGLGIIEVIVAMLLFGILAVAMVPPILLALQVTAKTTTIASAQEVAQERVEQARVAAALCADFRIFIAGEPADDYTDTRGARYSLTESFQVPGLTVAETEADTSWCKDESDPDAATVLVTYRVEVTSLDTDNPDVADVSTMIAVPGLG
ncbi:hypothetical protein GCM10025876_39150 [Demequina litorisediminis]|uniref:Type II secretion system protein n=1 Tax=Demequina litorisediminis TaxID=1849022 RepID=A0ABQ6IKU0_9MICO|nr:hypothetical protein GCM10025876_39150 [Demequina litorisediminis]